MRSRDRIARAIVRLYPRAWRARYEDELLALIDATPVSLGTLIDLVAGAVRERVRASARVPPRPVSLARELWRDLFRDLTTAVLVAAATWLAARQVSNSGVDVRVDLTPFIYLIVLTRVGIVFGRRYFIEYRATMSKRTVGAQDLLKPALSRVEYWCLLTCVGVGAGLYILSGPGRSLSGFGLQIYMLVSLLNSATRSRLEFADAQKAIRLARNA